MPNKHFYVALGAATGVAVVIALYRSRKRMFERYGWFRRLHTWDRDWFLYFPVLLLPFMLWALVPDILHGAALVPKEVTRSPWFDVFFFHSTFEAWEDAYPTLDWMLNSLGSMVLVLTALGINAYYVAEYRRRVRA